MSSQLAPGVAPIKAEYLAPPPASAAPFVPHATSHKLESSGPSGEASAPSGEKPTHERPITDADTQDSNPHKRQRGMNKHRKPFKHEQPEEGMKMCSAFVQTSACGYGNSCRYSHDIAAYFAQRPEDLGEECPIWTLRGDCRFGVTCRFGRSHLQDPSGLSLRKPVETPPYEEMNFVSFEITKQLRQNKYDFATTDRIAAAIIDDVNSKNEHLQQGTKGAADEQDDEERYARLKGAHAEEAAEADMAAEDVAVEETERDPGGSSSAAAASAAMAAYRDRLVNGATDVWIRPRKVRRSRCRSRWDPRPPDPSPPSPHSFVRSLVPLKNLRCISAASRGSDKSPMHLCLPLTHLRCISAASLTRHPSRASFSTRSACRLWRQAVPGAAHDCR